MLVFRGVNDFLEQRHLGVSENSGKTPPNHPILIGFSIRNHRFWGTSIFGNTRMKICLPCTGFGGIYIYLPKISLESDCLEKKCANPVFFGWVSSGHRDTVIFQPGIQPAITNESDLHHNWSCKGSANLVNSFDEVLINWWFLNYWPYLFPSNPKTKLMFKWPFYGLYMGVTILTTYWLGWSSK